MTSRALAIRIEAPRAGIRHVGFMIRRVRVLAVPAGGKSDDAPYPALARRLGQALAVGRSAVDV